MDDPLVIEGRVRANALRLRDDAALLLEAGRYPSCALLQFFALEELGKIALLRRSLPASRTSFHGQKQLTAMCLAYGTQAARFLRAKLSELGLPETRPPDTSNFDDLALLKEYANGAVWSWLGDGGWQEFHDALSENTQKVTAARVGLFEYFRRVATYVDARPEPPNYLNAALQAGDFGAAWAHEAMALIADADAALDDSPAFAVAMVIVERNPLTLLSVKRS
jgi:hypothetical protein